jgi:hypothetical protein
MRDDCSWHTFAYVITSLPAPFPGFMSIVAKRVRSRKTLGHDLAERELNNSNPFTNNSAKILMSAANIKKVHFVTWKTLSVVFLSYTIEEYRDVPPRRSPAYQSVLPR